IQQAGLLHHATDPADCSNGDDDADDDAASDADVGDSFGGLGLDSVTQTGSVSRGSSSGNSDEASFQQVFDFGFHSGLPCLTTLITERTAHAAVHTPTIIMDTYPPSSAVSENRLFAN